MSIFERPEFVMVERCDAGWRIALTLDGEVRTFTCLSADNLFRHVRKLLIARDKLADSEAA